MLREQDDPNSKIGKANDDSVLFPKRASRLNVFNHEGLSDIAEVASLSGSIKPPFLTERTGSYSSADGMGYGTDEESIGPGGMMSRSKPGQGNKFFGGRQKIYKIPVKGSSSLRDLSGTSHLASEPSRPMGKAVYDDDVSLSAFQALKAKEREDIAGRGGEGDNGNRSSEDEDPAQNAQSCEYNRKRETSSSTNSVPFEGRTSTAATSIASQGASPLYPSATVNSTFASSKPNATGGQERPGKGKRLYGQGIDQQLQEQQSSAMNRLNSIQQRNNPLGGNNGVNGIGQSRSATSLNDRFQKPGPLHVAGGFRAASPTPGSASVLGSFELGANGERSRSNSRDDENQKRQSPTMSPPMSPADPTLMAALEPNDVGKATASGAFNKPKTPYNEHQFAQRQLQLQEGRNTPPLKTISRTDTPNSLLGRLRNDSSASDNSGKSAGLQQAVTSVTRDGSTSSNLTGRSARLSSQQAVNGTYLASFSGSEYDSEPSSPIVPTNGPPSEPQRPPDPPVSNKYEHDDQHPAFNTHLGFEDDRSWQIAPHLASELDGRSRASMSVASGVIDSPTLPMADADVEYLGAGLNDLIRGHLRNDSNQSSIYPSSPGHGDRFPADFQQSLITEAPYVDTLSSDRYTAPDSATPMDQESMPPPLSVRARRILEQAQQLRNGPSKAYDVLGGVGADKVQQVLGGEAPRRSSETNRIPWQDQMKGHVRGGSTETQKEREDFASELADRRKQVQDNLKSFVKDESRSASPATGRTHDNSPARTGPLGLLKKSSRTSITGRNDSTSKVNRLFGGGPVPMSNGSSPNISSETPRDDRLPRQMSDESRPSFRSRVRDPNRVPGPGMGPPSSQERSIGAERRERFFRKTSPSPHSSQERPVPFGAKQPPPGSNSNGFGYARSRTDPFSNQQMSYHPAGRSRKYSPPRATNKPDRPATDGPPQPSSRSNSAMGHRPPILPSHAASNGSYFPNSPHSPNPHAMNYPPVISDSPRPSPVAPAFSAHTTAPLPPQQQSAPTNAAPTLISANSSGSNGSLNPRSPRKYSINKNTISEPTFLSGTSSVITVDLPAGASLNNGMDEIRAEAPPVPPLNPRRRRMPTTQDVLTAFGNKSTTNLPSQRTPTSATSNNLPYGMPDTPPYTEVSNFSADENEAKATKPRSRLRKSSSDGGSLAARARHQALMKEMESMPSSPQFMDDRIRNQKRVY